MQCFRSILLMVLSVFIMPLSASVQWQNDYEQALNLSQRENKPVLLFFNGSDWAVNAMKMKHEILSDSGFQDKISKNFICMEVDFPKHTLLSSKLIAQNNELKNRFKIHDLPALVLLDSQERVIAQVVYLPENGTQLANDLLQIVAQDKALAAGLEHLEKASVVQLKQHYQRAQELGFQAAIDRILIAGIKTEDPYFLLEKYRLLVDNQEMKSEEALSLRQKLLSLPAAASTIDGQKIAFTLALIDFQALSGKDNEPKEIVQPLVDYLNRAGEADQANRWRIEMMIAETYLDADKWQEALIHAESAYQNAPETMRSEIAHSLDYIRSSAQETNCLR